MKSILFCLLLSFIIFSCSDSPTKIERDNPNDPESIGFELDTTQSFSTEILEDKTIKIIWEDSSKAPTHYILRKKILASEEFQTLDTLSSESKFFIDESGEINLNTEYEIQSVRVQKNDSIITSDRVTSEINFGTLQTQSVSYNPDTTAIEFEWKFESKWPFIGVAYYIDYDVVNETSLDTLYNLKSYTTPEFEKDFAERYYQIRFFVSEEDIEKGNIYQGISGAYYGGMEFLPEITNIEIINEGKVVINWEDNSGFEDGFELYRKKIGYENEYSLISTFEENVNSYTDSLQPFAKQFQDNQDNRKTAYGIKAVKNNTSTGSFGSEIIFNVLIDLHFISSDNEKVTFEWNTDKPELVEEYIIFKKTGDGYEQTHLKVPNDVFRYTLDNLEQDIYHKIWIGSNYSNASNWIRVYLPSNND